ncbi:hypothetical protein E4P42_03060 [Mycobacterium sp. PS03-16]|uniref:hypothetical protein n=1 Tax=Mycobacterium sp. PS03-16 TaxID=2559611 RepID=UPI0010741F3C|nr:hypothetical protein [Mycobacterium sp. PS03-16]TFV61164.1 hypothetical protein E4P42_03060 [Mycobacterium sp. PS03-16]
MELTLQRIGAWSGTVMILLYGTCFSGIARLFPPLSPTAPADEIADFFVDHRLAIRLGVAGAMLTATLALPFLAVICLRIRRVEGRWGMLSLTQLFAATIFVPALLFPQLLLATAAFRPEQRSAELTQMLNDLFWLWFIGIVGTIVIQNVTLAVATFVDTTDPPTFPRWYGYLNLWVATLSMPGCVVVVFNDGPLAWHGVFAFYIPGLVLCVWIFASTAVIARSVAAQQAAERSPVPAA